MHQLVKSNSNAIEVSGTWDTGCRICMAFLEDKHVTQAVLVDKVKKLQQQMQQDQERISGGIKRVTENQLGQPAGLKRDPDIKQEDMDQDEIPDDSEVVSMGKVEMMRTALRSNPTVV